jgi:hypothetical protein
MTTDAQPTPEQRSALGALLRELLNAARVTDDMGRPLADYNEAWELAYGILQPLEKRPWNVAEAREQLSRYQEQYLGAPDYVAQFDAIFPLG